MPRFAPSLFALAALACADPEVCSGLACSEGADSSVLLQLPRAALVQKPEEEAPVSSTVKEYLVKFAAEAYSSKNRTTLLEVAPGSGALQASVSTREFSSDATAYLSWSSPIYYDTRRLMSNSRSMFKSSVLASGYSSSTFALPMTPFWVDVEGSMDKLMEVSMEISSCPEGYLIDQSETCSIQVNTLMETSEKPRGEGTTSVGAGNAATFEIESMVPVFQRKGVFVHTFQFNFKATGESGEPVPWSDLKMLYLGNSACSPGYCIPFLDGGMDLAPNSDGSAGLNCSIYGACGPFWVGGMTNSAESILFGLFPLENTLSEAISLEWSFEGVGCAYSAADIKIPASKDVSDFKGVKIGEKCDIPLVQARLNTSVEATVDANETHLVFMVEVPSDEPLASLVVQGPSASYQDLCAYWQLPMGSREPERNQECLEPDDFNYTSGEFKFLSPFAGIWYFMTPVTEGKTTLSTRTASAESGTNVVKLTDFRKTCDKCSTPCIIDMASESAECAPESEASDE